MVKVIPEIKKAEGEKLSNPQLEVLEEMTKQTEKFLEYLNDGAEKLIIWALLAMSLDVLTDYIFICMFTNSRYKVTVCPELATP
jgi:hypothetical protein